MQGCWRIILGLALCVTCWAIAPTLAYAQADGAYLGNQSMQIPASLIAPDADMKIAIYPQPNTRQPRIGYGLNGDPVIVVEQTGSNDGTTWNRVQFEGSPDAEGWVQMEYLSIQPAESPPSTSQANGQPDRYLGNRGAQQRSLPFQSAYQQPDQRQPQDQQRHYR